MAGRCRVETGRGAFAQLYPEHPPGVMGCVPPCKLSIKRQRCPQRKARACPVCELRGDAGACAGRWGPAAAGPHCPRPGVHAGHKHTAGWCPFTGRWPLSLGLADEKRSRADSAHLRVSMAEEEAVLFFLPLVQGQPGELSGWHRTHKGRPNPGLFLVKLC